MTDTTINFMQALLPWGVFLFGLMIGSFLNVCIYRLPRQESIILPSSHCTACQQPLAWYDNIPALSYVLLLGRCRYCHQHYSIRYLFIELITGGIWWLSFHHFGMMPAFAVWAVFLSMLLAITAIDFETGLIPDAITLPGILLGLVVSLIVPGVLGGEIYSRIASFVFSFAGGVAGAGAILLVAWLGKMLFKKESMGGGDIKLLAMIGVYLGYQKVLLTFFIAPFLALPFALYQKFLKKEETIPYGPFLAGAAVIQLFWGQIILNYLFRY